MPRPPTPRELLIPAVLLGAAALGVAYLLAWWLAAPGSWTATAHAELTVAILLGAALLVLVLGRLAHGRAVDRFVAGHVEQQLERYMQESGERAPGPEPGATGGSEPGEGGR